MLKFLYKLNFIEGHIKNAYFPRELIIENLNEEKNLIKNQGNKLLTIPEIHSKNEYKFNLIFSNSLNNVLST